ncbi:kinesin-like protein KIN-14P isoform X3 [Gossypium hirsutum]|uniref:Kinesin-like protein KIN-14P isoform X3 n=1 Tax=Gossypium hirsutum TaxID=3635 RepID=A0ABM2Z2I0_GOSHI|nr:kinesin-like protein KIN-14P isoform X3 [Gossypium hirsutum]
MANSNYENQSGNVPGDAPLRGPLTPLSGEERRKASSDLKNQQQSTTGLHHGGHNFHEVFQWKQGRYADLPGAKISEMMKSNSLDNAPTQSLLSVVNGILDESLDRKNGEIPHRVACLLRKVVQEIERRISTQADHLRTQNNLFKIREEKYKSRIRVLETLAAGNGEEIKIVTVHPQQTKTESPKVEENQKVEEKVKDKRESVKETDKHEIHEHETSKHEIDKQAIKQETEKHIREIASLKQELQMAKTIHEQQCLEMQKETEGVKAGLQARLNELESLLNDSNNRVKELKTSAKSKCQSWSMKVNNYQSFMDSQFHAMRDLRFTSDAIKQELLKTQKSYFEEFNLLEVKLKALADAAGNYREVLNENRKLFNEIQDLRGNIRVFCRVRPFLPGQNGKQTIVESIGDNGQLVVTNPAKPGKEGQKTFKFNKVFGPAATQGEVFADIQPFIQSVVDGYNVCIFAYGQTGSGKTYTMTGPNDATEEEWGVNFRALNNLFKISQNRRSTFQYEVGVQVVEIYNDQVRDLLSNRTGPAKKYPFFHRIHSLFECFYFRYYCCDIVIFLFLNPHTMGVTSISQPNGLAVPDASMHPVLSTTDVIDLINLGFKNRTVSATALNERSSRSHSIVTVHVRGKDLKAGNYIYGNLHLVDLAGSERVDRSEVTGDRLKEAQHINKSLSSLGDVIFALAQKSPHVPYRNSKLTQVLQSSLGGQAKTLMFVQLNPDVTSYSESLSTLKFAERVSGVELGAARSSKEGKDVKELMEQMASLKDTIAKKDEEIERLHLLKDLKNGYPGVDGEQPRTGSLSDKQSETGSSDDEKSEITDAALSMGTETDGSAEYVHSPEGVSLGKPKVVPKVRVLQKPAQATPTSKSESPRASSPAIKKTLSSSSNLVKPVVRKKV